MQGLPKFMVGKPDALATRIHEAVNGATFFELRRLISRKKGHKRESVKSLTQPPAHGQRITRLALTTSETAASLGIDEVTVWRLCKRGLLTPNRATRRPLFPVSEIERFLSEGRA